MTKYFLWIIAFGLAPTVFASVLYYGGDPDGALGLGVVSGTDGTTPLRPFEVTEARVFDDFVVPEGGWTITALGGNFITETPTAYWLDYEIRTGVSEGVGGTLISSGIALPTVTPNGFDYFETGYYVEMVFPLLSADSIELGPGTYWLGLSWRNYISGRGTIPYLQPASSANSVGGPFKNGSFWNAPADFGINFMDIAPIYGVENVDFSYRIQGTAGSAAIPEPASWLLMGTGVGFIGVVRRETLRRALAAAKL